MTLQDACEAYYDHVQRFGSSSSSSRENKSAVDIINEYD